MSTVWPSWIVVGASGAAIANLVGWYVYARLQAKGAIEGDPVAWLLSCLIVSVSTLTNIGLTNDLMSGMLYMAGAIPCLLVFCLSCYKNPFRPSRSQKALIGIALTMLAIAWVSPEEGLALAALYYGVTYFIFGRSIWLGSCKERSLPWLIWSGAAGLQVIANSQQGNIESMLLPLVNLTCWTTISYLAWHLEARGRFGVEK